MAITRGPTLRLLNRQRRDPVPLAWLGRLARCAARDVQIGSRGEFLIAFVDAARMRRLHQKFLGRRTMTDVLTFRYETSKRPGPRDVLGEIVIAPAAARTYAKRHGLRYRDELARYVVHGLLHWAGHDDRTPAQQRTMRVLENTVLKTCASLRG